MLKKTCKYHKCVLATKLIFHNLPKSNGEIQLLFVKGPVAILTSSQQKNVITTPLSISLSKEELKVFLNGKGEEILLFKSPAKFC